MNCRNGKIEYAVDLDFYYRPGSARCDFLKHYTEYSLFAGLGVASCHGVHARSYYSSYVSDNPGGSARLHFPSRGLRKRDWDEREVAVWSALLRYICWRICHEMSDCHFDIVY